MFTGFSSEAVDFFWQIRFNNSREWFQPRKEEFSALVMRPTKQLAEELYDWFRQTYPELRLNLHISRIYRDARRLFGRGPLKDNIWFSFQNEIGTNGEAPCFWFELGCEGYGYGFGYWAQPSAAQRYRKKIDLEPKKFEKLVRSLEKQDVFVLEGPEYAKPKGHAAEPIGKWYNKKWVSLACHRSCDELFCSRELLTAVQDGFSSLVPFYRFMDQIYRSTD